MPFGFSQQYWDRYRQELYLHLSQRALYEEREEEKMAEPTVRGFQGRPFTLTINRRGEVTLSGDSANQCKAVRHRTFKYVVRLTAEAEHVNSQGYLIEHERIHAIMVESFKMGDSCERLAVRAATNLLTILPFPATRLRVTVTPHNPYIPKEIPQAFIDIDWNQQEVMRIQQPAVDPKVVQVRELLLKAASIMGDADKQSARTQMALDIETAKQYTGAFLPEKGLRK